MRYERIDGWVQFPHFPHKIMETTNDNQVIKKWMAVLEYTSNIISKLEEGKWLKLANQLEEIEHTYCRYPKFLKRFIPIVRIMEGDVNISYEMVHGSICVVTKGILMTTYPDIVDIAIPMTPEQDLTSSYCYEGVYVKEDNIWKWR